VSETDSPDRGYRHDLLWARPVGAAVRGMKIQPAFGGMCWRRICLQYRRTKKTDEGAVGRESMLWRKTLLRHRVEQTNGSAQHAGAYHASKSNHDRREPMAAVQC